MPQKPIWQILESPDIPVSSSIPEADEDFSHNDNTAGDSDVPAEIFYYVTPGKRVEIFPSNQNTFAEIVFEGPPQRLFEKNTALVAKITKSKNQM